MRKMNEMPYHMGFTVKIYPSAYGKHLISVNDGARRFVYNRLVANGNEIYQLKKVGIYCEPVNNRIEYLQTVSDAKGICNSAPFLYGKEIDSQTVANAIKNYHAAWKNMRERHGGVPTFCKKSNEQHYQTNNHYKAKSVHMNDGNVRIEDMHHITLPKLGRVRFDGSPKRIRMILEHAGRCDTRIGTVTIKKDDCDEYWVSLALASEEPFFETLPKTNSQLGIDLNVENFLSDSNGNVIDNPRFLNVHTGKLQKIQRRVSLQADKNKKAGRDLKDCKTYQKARKKLSYEHRLVTRQRKDFQHCVSKYIIENQDFIVAEDLKVKNLLKNHCLAKAISDVSWSSFLTMLNYKADVYGRIFVKVPPQYTTQACFECGYVLKKEEHIDLTVRDWTCPRCNTYHLRDVNSAKNILKKAVHINN